MSNIKKFSYQDTSKRWLIPVAIFLTFFSFILLLTDIILSFKQYLPYYPVTSIVLIIAVISFFLGNLSGKIFYKLINRSIIINIIFTILYGTAISFYFLKVTILGDSFANLNIYFFNRYLASLIIVLPAFFSGVLNCYFLNISTGDFLDEKNLLSAYLLSFFTAVSSGLIIASKNLLPDFDLNIITPYYSIISLILVVIMIFINMKFNPEPLFAKHYIDDETTDENNPVKRDDLFYTYLNFTYVITYIFLGHLVLIKFYGNIHYHGQIYIAIVLLALSAGYLVGKLKKPSFWYVYSEMLFPILFLSYMFLLFYFSDKISINTAYAFTAAPALIYGFSLRQTFENILTKYDHNRRFNIINFSLYILPIPVIISISLLHFTNLVFYLILYIISILNIIIPGIFLFNLKINPVKKFAYFIFTLIFIPAVLLLHLYFKIPLTLKPFFTRCENYEILLKTNYNLPYITENGEITIYDTPVFYLSDSNIRNLKRAASAAALYAGENSNTLILDSNQKFFSNPVYSIIPDFLCLDTLPSRHIDNNRLPVSGKQKYTPVQKELLNFLLDNKKMYDMVLDCPNLLDQTIHSFRTSSEYYTLVKKQIGNIGVYAVIFDLKYTDDTMLITSLTHLKEKFAHHTIYLFSDILLIVSSDNQDSLKLSKESLNRLEPLYSERGVSDKIFYNELHPLNNILFTGIDQCLQKFSEEKRRISDNGYKILPEKLLNYYLNYTPDWYKTVINDSDKRFYQNLRSFMQRNSKVFSIIKKLEYSESMNEYDSETGYLFQLKNYARYSDSLKNYINAQLAYKEKYYQSEALRLEKNKKWNEAAKLYKAILSLNDDIFEANYKLGLLYITLQDMDNAFIYLDKALKLEKNNPQVLYQMGILMFFSDKWKDAINYLEQANKQNIHTSLLYMYLGISYEKSGKNEDAKLNYEKAILEDPNDNKIKLLLENLNIKMNTTLTGEHESQKTNMIDDEKDEKITIPVNKKAINARLQDDEKDDE
ncbi:MAG TPA: tetratricopeptide repeat protein [Spirochaetota bacterium]|nr:tetratricopeptide repeat protein [Spirochaetota bacterium]HPJ34518.1 tetratricopeptide repeat protein [Spirochaetota bacterium]